LPFDGFGMKHPEVRLIYACAANGVIGRDNTIPWHLPEDLAHFRQLTTGAPVIMGRRTWDSLPPRFKPLPGRSNLVLTRQETWNENGSEPFQDLRTALSFCENEACVWVIGGAQIYAEALPLASRVEVTEIAQAFEGDAWAPELSPTEWEETQREARTTATGLQFSFVRYQRRRQTPTL
jgi:dihydrofolate reductase